MTTIDRLQCKNHKGHTEYLAGRAKIVAPHARWYVISDDITVDAMGRATRQDPKWGAVSVICPEPTCGAGLSGRQIKATLTTKECAADCQQATSDTCKCACGGINHGVC